MVPSFGNCFSAPPTRRFRGHGVWKVVLSSHRSWVSSTQLSTSLNQGLRLSPGSVGYMGAVICKTGPLEGQSLGPCQLWRMKPLAGQLSKQQALPPSSRRPSTPPVGTQPGPRLLASAGVREVGHRMSQKQSMWPPHRCPRPWRHADQGTGSHSITDSQ